MIKSKTEFKSNLLEIFKAITQLQTKKIKAGVLDRSEKNSETGESVVDYAVYNQFGYGVPARAFMTIGGLFSKKNTEPLVINMLNDLFRLKPINKHLSIIAKQMSSDIKYAIDPTQISPALSKTTIEIKRKKGRSNPSKTLVDTKSLHGSIKFSVEIKNVV